MAKQEYELQIVLEKRDREKQEAEKKRMEAIEALKVEKCKLEQRKEERKQIDLTKIKATEEFHANLSKPGCSIAEEADRHDAYQKWLDAEAVKKDQEIQQQMQVVRRAEIRVAEAEDELNQAIIAFEALKEHKAAWQKRVKKEEMEREQAALEEIGQSLWLDQQRKQQAREERRR